MHGFCLTGLVLTGIPSVAEAVVLDAGDEVEVEVEDGLAAGGPGVLEEVQAGGVDRLYDGFGEAGEV